MALYSVVNNCSIVCIDNLPHVVHTAVTVVVVEYLIKLTAFWEVSVDHREISLLCLW